MSHSDSRQRLSSCSFGGIFFDKSCRKRTSNHSGVGCCESTSSNSVNIVIFFSLGKSPNYRSPIESVYAMVTTIKRRQTRESTRKLFHLSLDYVVVKELLQSK